MSWPTSSTGRRPAKARRRKSPATMPAKNRRSHRLTSCTTTNRDRTDEDRRANHNAPAKPFQPADKVGSGISGELQPRGGTLAVAAVPRRENLQTSLWGQVMKIHPRWIAELHRFAKISTDSWPTLQKRMNALGFVERKRLLFTVKFII